MQPAENEDISERESSLPNHLINPAGQTTAQNPQNPDLAKQDFALYEALNVLKTMAILQATIAPETQLPDNAVPPAEGQAADSAPTTQAAKTADNATNKNTGKTETKPADKTEAQKIPAGFGR